ncbi:TolC family protein [Tautonia rosea]|uniref:TolC family protein n=1 Tax=Tautonia rosea TaxID=2728037 RepID=UPI001473F8D5|nr:TolC family protein [Tautonia rosea]
MKFGLVRIRTLGLLAGAVTLVGLECLGQESGRSFPPVTPGDPTSSALGDAPGVSGTVDLGGSSGIEQVIPVGPGPSYPRVPRGITQPPEPFGLQEGLGIETSTPLVESALPIGGQLGTAPLEELEGPPNGLTIDQAIDRLLVLNLELRAQAMEISKARADVLTAGLRGNPLIYTDAALIPYGNFDDSAGGPTQYDLNITLPIDLNGKRKRRIEVATRAQEVTEALYQDAVRLQIDNLYTAWIDVLAAQATIQFLKAGLDSLENQKRITEQRVREGTLSRTEFNNIEILIDSTDLTLLEALETYDDAKRTLAALLLIPFEDAETFPIQGTLRGLDLPSPPIEFLIEQAKAIRPDLAAFRLGVHRAQSEVRLARANRVDDLFLVYQPFTAQEPLLPGERLSTSWAMGVTIPVPVFNRNQGNIARAQHTVVQTQTQLENLERQIILEVQRAEAAYSVTLATIKRLQEETLPAAQENLELSLAQRGPEEPDPISRIEAQRAFGDIARQYLDALVRHRRSMFRLNTAVGTRVFP